MMYLNNLIARKSLTIHSFYLIFICCCLTLLFVYPVYNHISFEYEYFKFADIILNSTKWLHQLDFSNGSSHDGLTDVTTYRTIGYPLIIALFKWCFNDLYVNAILIFQILLWCYSSFIFGNFLEEFGFTKFSKWIFILSYLTGWGFITQFQFQTDAVYTSIFTILIIYCARLILREQIYTSAKLLKCGVLLLSCFLIREATLQISLIFISLFLVNIKTTISKNEFKKMIVSMAVFYMPLIAFVLAQSFWNCYRSGGEFFITLGTRTAIAVPIEHAIELDQKVLQNSVLFDDEAKNIIYSNHKKMNDLYVKKFNFDVNKWYQLLDVIIDMKKKYSLTECAIDKLIKKEYFRLWMEHPRVMFKVVKENLIFPDIFFIFRPLESIENYYNLYHERCGDGKRLVHFSDLKKMSYKQWQLQDVFFVLFVNLCRMFSVFIMLICFKKIATVFFRCMHFDSTVSLKDRVILFFLLIYIGYMLAYAVVHVEARYLAAIFSLPVFVGLYGLQVVPIKNLKIMWRGNA